MHANLIEQAFALARRGTSPSTSPGSTGAPRQADLRRAVSTAYYGLFHYLVEQSCRAVIGSQHSQQGYRNALARAFTHQTMKSLCKCYSEEKHPAVVTKSLSRFNAGPHSFIPEIVNLSGLFVALQQKRHLADYDLSEKFSRTEVVALIEEVERRIRAFEVLPASDERQFFLVGLLVWKELVNR